MVSAISQNIYHVSFSSIGQNTQGIIKSETSNCRAPGKIPNSPKKWLFICLKPSCDHALIYSQGIFVQS